MWKPWCPGSAATGLADEESDYDLYAYTREAVPIEFRANLLKPRAARLELHNIFLEWSDEWVGPYGTPFDLIYRSCEAIEADAEARLGRGLALLGLESCVPDHLDAMRARLECYLQEQGLLPPSVEKMGWHGGRFRISGLQRTSEAFNRSNCSSSIRKAPVCSVLVP